MKRLRHLVLFLCCPVVVSGFLTGTATNRLGRRLQNRQCRRQSFFATPVTSTDFAAESFVTNDEDLMEQTAVGLREDVFFTLDESVHYWKEFDSLGTEQNMERIRQIIEENLFSSSSTTLSRAYFASHLLRTGYFTFNAFIGSLASDLHERFIVDRQQSTQQSEEDIMQKDTTRGASSSASIVGQNRGNMVSRLIQSDIPSRLLLETIKSYQQDFNWIEQGILAYPWDALVEVRDQSGKIKFQAQHQQFNPLFVLSETQKVVRESIAIFSRRNKGIPQRVAWQGPESNLYPAYYLNDFHYQTDGWMSSASAERYEVSTETLFLGRQDAMQRQTLLPLLKSERRPHKILEVGCGTGRFATFLRDNLPEAQVTLSDLSPYYLEKARENDSYWRKHTGKDKTTRPVTCVQANAEHLPFPDNSFDAVVSIYLFHELPEDARNRAAAEMVRVCRPGGTIVFTDSIQLGDRPKFQNIANFGQLNEPHYENYVQSAFLPDLFAGTSCGEKYVSSSTKTVSFVKYECEKNHVDATRHGSPDETP